MPHPSEWRPALIQRNHHFLVIGGTSGIGLVTVRLLASTGCKVSVFSRRIPERRKRIAAVKYWRTDVTQAVDIQQHIEQVATARGPLTDILFFQRYRGTGEEWEGEIATTLTATKNVIECASR